MTARRDRRGPAPGAGRRIGIGPFIRRAAMVIGICTIELFIPEARSLKDKRQVLRRVIDRLRHRHNVSVSEVEHQDLWQRAGIALAAVGPSRRTIEAMFETILDEIDQDRPGLIARHQVEFV